MLTSIHTLRNKCFQGLFELLFKSSTENTPLELAAPG